MPAPSSIISFRPLLVEAVDEFLKSLGWLDVGLANAVAEIATSLAKYREEGKRLFPVVFLTQDMPSLLQQLNGTDPVTIGHGPLVPETIRRALKHCAPLGEGRSWVVYLHIDPAAAAQAPVSYGVFRTLGSPIQPTSLERLRRMPATPTPLLGIVQLAENVIEIRANADDCRYIHLSGLSSDGHPPTRTTRDFLEAISRDVNPELKDYVSNFYYRVVSDVMQTWHGNLSVVIPKGNPIPSSLTDGVILAKPIDIQERIFTHKTSSAKCTTDELRAEGNLIRGMMGADGITLLRSDGAVIGYNVFYHTRSGLELDAAPEGGARRRTFQLLSKKVGSDLSAVFYRSQDGYAECVSQHSR